MKSFDDIFSEFGGPAKLGRAIGVTSEHASLMKRRKAIPPAHWSALVSAAKDQGIPGVDHETLTRLYANRETEGQAA